MMASLNPIPIMLLVTDVLDRLAIPYLIGGSLASIIHGMVRTTRDVDLVVDMKAHHAAPFARALEGEFYVYLDSILEAIVFESSFNVIHNETSFKIDIFIAKQRAFDRSQMGRKSQEVISRRPQRLAWVSSAEDIILAKLEWFRMGGEISERQWRDVLGVIKMQMGQLDEQYLRQWAPPLGVSDLLEGALLEGKKTE